MGLLGRVSSLWSGAPSQPSAPKWSASPAFAMGTREVSGPLGMTLKVPTGTYAEGTVGARSLEGDKALYERIMANLEREPGLDEETIRNLIMGGAEQTKLEEQGALRRLNQGTAGTGRYATGGRMAGRADILAGGARTRADLRRQVLTDAAKIALQDRYQQLAQLTGYVDPRIQMGQGESLAKNQFNLGNYGQQLEAWKQASDEYYRNFDWSWAEMQKAAKSIIGGMAGGGAGAAGGIAGGMM